MSSLDIVIVNRNSTDYLLRCLESIFQESSGVDTKVFVQDNASQDGVDRVDALFPQVELTKNACNMGFAKAINRAMNQSSAPYICILNPDSVVVDGAFHSLIRSLEENPEAGVIGPKILEHDGAVQGSARSFPTPLTALFGRNSPLTKLFPNNRMSRANILTACCDGETAMEVDWVSGACLVVRRKAVEQVGPLDEQFFIYWEDADWCRRMWENGWKVIYYPGASVIHYVGGSSEKDLFRSVLEFHKSSYLLFKKYVQPPISFLNPLVLSALALRFILVLTWQMVRRAVVRLNAKKTGKAYSAPPPRKGKIRIVRIIARLNIGGPAMNVYSLTKGLDKDKFRSTVVTGRISSKEGDMSYLFDSIDTKPIVIPELRRDISVKMDLKAVIRVSKILRREKPNIVHTHTSKAGSSARLAALFYNLVSGKKLRTVHTFHGHVFEGYFSKKKALIFVWVERLLARGTDVIIAISKTQKTDLAKKFRIAPQEKIKTVSLGFDLKPFLTSKALKGQFRRKFGIDDHAFLVGIVGRLVPIKNHVMFLKTAKRLVERHPQKPMVFVVVGDGELREELESFCRNQGLWDHVRFCGWIKEISYAYADLDVVALTSMNEGTPVSIIEAMASGVPVIATDVGGISDLLGPHMGGLSSNGFEVCERGILCRQNDVLGFEKGLEYLSKAEEDEKRDRLRRARSFVEGRFSERRLIDDMTSIYLDLMNGGARRGTPLNDYRRPAKGLLGGYAGYECDQNE